MYRRGDGEWRSFLSPKGTICIDPSGSELFCQDSNGKDIPVDGHFMCFGGGSERYAATRAWGWNHAFVDTALTAMAVEEETAMETGVTQIAGEHSAAESSHGRTAAAHGEAEAVASSVRAPSHGEAGGAEAPGKRRWKPRTPQWLQHWTMCKALLAAANITTAWGRRKCKTLSASDFVLQTRRTI